MLRIGFDGAWRLATFGVVACLLTQAVNAASAPRFAGIAFVDSSVTALGSRATLPAGVKIHAPGSRITGTDGCPTNRYMTDGLIVAIIEYSGAPTAASLAVVRNPASGGRFENAPYYLDLNPGRTLQYLGPIFENGTYELKVTSGLGQAKNLEAGGNFTLARNCPQLR
jgi:hypothetical protein